MRFVMRLAVIFPALVLWAGFPACRLQRHVDPLEEEQLGQRLDSAVAAQQTLEQEYLREQAHMNAMWQEVAALRHREEALALEAHDLDLRVEEAQYQVTTLQDQLDQLHDLKVAGEDQLDAAKTPRDRRGLKDRIAALLAEVDRLRAVLARLPPGPAASPAEKPTAPPEPTEKDPANGG